MEWIIFVSALLNIVMFVIIMIKDYEVKQYRQLILDVVIELNNLKNYLIKQQRNKP